MRQPVLIEQTFPPVLCEADMSTEKQERIVRATQAVDPQIWLITSAAEGRNGGLVATFVTKASIVPDRQRYVIGIAKQHHTWQLIEQSGVCALHLIAEHQVDWVLQLGAASGHETNGDKLSPFRQTTLTTGAPILQDALVAFDCRVEARLNSGDRSIYLLQVVDAMSQPQLLTPLRYSTMQSVLTDEQRSQLADLYRRDQQVDRNAINDWRADFLESQS